VFTPPDGVGGAADGSGGGGRTGPGATDRCQHGSGRKHRAYDERERPLRRFVLNLGGRGAMPRRRRSALVSGCSTWS